MIDEIHSDVCDGASPSIAQGGGVPLPLTRGQLEIYVEQKLNAESPLFNIGALVRVEGRIDPQRMVAAIRHVADSAAAFRTVMLDTDEGPRQMVLDRFIGAVDLVDLSGEDDPEAAARLFMERDMAVPLPFGPNGPLVRFAVFQCSPDVRYWYGKFHHIVADGWGTSLFHAALVKSFNARSPDGSFPELDLGSVVQQLDDEKQYRASPAFEAGRKYWQERFPALPEPLFTQNGAYTTRAFRRTLHLNGALYGRIRALATEEKASPFSSPAGGARDRPVASMLHPRPDRGGPDPEPPDRRRQADHRPLRQRVSRQAVPGRPHQHARPDRKPARRIAPGLPLPALPDVRTQAAGTAGGFRPQPPARGQPVLRTPSLWRTDRGRLQPHHRPDQRASEPAAPGLRPRLRRSRRHRGRFRLQRMLLRSSDRRRIGGALPPDRLGGGGRAGSADRRSAMAVSVRTRLAGPRRQRRRSGAPDRDAGGVVRGDRRDVSRPHRAERRHRNSDLQ